MNETLRVAMTERGLSCEALAEKVGVDPKTVNRWLSPGRIPHGRHRSAAAKILGREILDLWPDAGRRRDVPWFRPWREAEEAAASLRWFEPSVIPGLLQTEAYARAVLASGPIAAEDVERFVKVRLERQRAVFDRPRPPLAVFVVDEAALRRGAPELMHEQLDHLVEMASRPNIFVHVIPFSAGLYPGQAGPFVIGGVEGSRDVSYLDNQLAGQLVTDPKEVAELVRVWDAVRGHALPRDLSIELMRARPWTK
ncbi:Scr1 family TA system antitoxin-like transcriptional regulator [Micromonospora sp. NPDC050397]|uniref:helix-turn-helix domain-containing protein n=1 Tax=Micromonospora sp. NPDC050397 TaxID=3364279 RepID=UPI00384AE5D9